GHPVGRNEQLPPGFEEVVGVHFVVGVGDEPELLRVAVEVVGQDVEPLARLEGVAEAGRRRRDEAGPQGADGPPVRAGHPDDAHLLVTAAFEDHGCPPLGGYSNTDRLGLTPNAEALVRLRAAMTSLTFCVYL